MSRVFVRNLCVPLMLAALIAGCSDKKGEVTQGAKAPDPVAAKVNGTELTVLQVNLALERIPNLDKEQSKAASLQVVRNLVDQEIIAQKALADKLDSDPVVKQALESARRQVLAEAYMSRKLGKPAEPSDIEVSDYYDKHPELFSKRKIYRLQEVSIKAPEDRHEAIRAQLAASKTLNDFAEWLKSENLPAKAAQGVKPAEQLPLDLLPKLAQMPDGQAIVVNAPGGLLVVVLADSQMQPVTLEQAKPAIARMLQTQSRQKAAKAELDALKATAKIEFMGDYVEAGKQDQSVAPTSSGPQSTETAPVSTPAADPATVKKEVPVQK